MPLSSLTCIPNRFYFKYHTELEVVVLSDSRKCGLIILLVTDFWHKSPANVECSCLFMNFLSYLVVITDEKDYRLS